MRAWNVRAVSNGPHIAALQPTGRRYAEEVAIKTLDELATRELR